MSKWELGKKFNAGTLAVRDVPKHVEPVKNWEYFMEASSTNQHGLPVSDSNWSGGSICYFLILHVGF